MTENEIFALTEKTEDQVMVFVQGMYGQRLAAQPEVGRIVRACVIRAAETGIRAAMEHAKKEPS